MNWIHWMAIVFFSCTVGLRLSTGERKDAVLVGVMWFETCLLLLSGGGL